MDDRMKVNLFDYTGAGTDDPAHYAACMLIFTKSTRLNLTPDLLNQIMNDWPEEKILEELNYMANTIPSSWEFCHYSFLITGVTRAFTHQLVRTRTASFAQQTMRTVDVQGWDYSTGPTVEDDEDRLESYGDTMAAIERGYKELIDLGAKPEDARGVLPTNIQTNICMSMNLRGLADLFRKRATSRVQGEYRDVIELIKEAMVAVHPWTTIFFDRTADRAAKELDEEIQKMPIPQVDRIRVTKLLDQIRNA